MVIARGEANIRPGPDEAVEFTRHDPATLSIESEMPLHRRRKFDALALIGLAMSDRRDEKLRSIAKNRPGDDHRDRPILQPFILALVRFVRPQISVAENVSRLGRLP